MTLFSINLFLQLACLISQIYLSSVDQLRFATVIKAETPDERILRNHLTSKPQ